ncbi:MAG TPA: long-chain fatty acid--CoA ligase, partial [Hellea balneolensis]|nr:long-chain fatty acid--CoA ligase [Hellea balneolensis]
MTLPPTPSYDECVKSLTSSGEIFALCQRTHYGVPMTDFSERPHHLSELLPTIEAYGERECLIYGDARLNYRDFVAQIHEFANFLHSELKVRRGDRVAILAFNRPEWIIAFWAITLVGGIAVAMNSWWTEAEINQALAITKPETLICDAKCFKKLNTSPKGVKNVVLMDEWPVEEYSEAKVFPFFQTGRLRRPPFATAPVDVTEGDIAAIFFTSGTTGQPKGVAISHRAWLVGLMNAALAATIIKTLQPDLEIIDQDIRFLATLPFFHVGGGHGIVLSGIVGGHTIVIAKGRFDPLTTVELIEKERITRWSAVPAMVQSVCALPEAQNRDLSSLTSIAYGAAPSSPRLQQLAFLTFRNLRAVSNAFGMSETGSVFAMNTGNDYRERPQSIGRAFPTADIRIVDAQGRPVKAGDIGELQVRGLFLMEGYWGQKNTPFTQDHFLPTGDMAYID